MAQKKNPAAPLTTFSPAQVARSLCVNGDKVRGWIREGELDAVNVGNARRPRWRIPEQSLTDFLKRRSSSPPSTVSRRRSTTVQQFV